jgi:hypothetical protein
MGGGIQKALIGAFCETAGKVPETRKSSNAQVYTIADALKSAKQQVAFGGILFSTSVTS